MALAPAQRDAALEAVERACRTLGVAGLSGVEMNQMSDIVCDAIDDAEDLTDK